MRVRVAGGAVEDVREMPGATSASLLLSGRRHFVISKHDPRVSDEGLMGPLFVCGLAHAWTTKWSHLADSNGRPTVYETKGPT
jgi:hypothetical protein